MQSLISVPGRCLSPSTQGWHGQRADSGGASPVAVLWTAGLGSGSPEQLPRDLGGLPRALPGPGCRGTDRRPSTGSVPEETPVPPPSPPAPGRGPSAPRETAKGRGLAFGAAAAAARALTGSAARGPRAEPCPAQPSPAGRGRPARLRWEREEPRPPPTGETSALSLAPQTPFASVSGTRAGPLRR